MSKRAASGSPIDLGSTPATKKPRTSASEPSVTKILSLSESSLKALKKETLVSHVVALQNAWSQFQADNGALSPSTGGASSQSTAAPVLDEVKIKEKAVKAGEMMYKGIKQQMKWQPSCKTKGKRFSYEGMVASSAIFYRLFRLEQNGKEWKQKKIPKTNLYRACGGVPETSVRYGGSLGIKGDEITLKWNKDDNTFSVSGLYGL